jgi:uncharacterized protein YbjQ (UPF0145 family)
MSFDLIIFLILIVIGYSVGQYNERKHFHSIIAREKRYKSILTFSERHIPAQQGAVSVQLVSGSVVISIDYFKQFVAGLRNLIGGRVTAYESLLERARREALLRMKEQAKDLGASSVWNIRLETAAISQGAAQQIGSIEVIAYGTALITEQIQHPS